MKRLINILTFTLVLLGLLVAVTNAQVITTPNSKHYAQMSVKNSGDALWLYYPNLKLDSAAYCETQVFDLTPFVNDTNYISYSYRTVKLATSDSINFKVYVYTNFLASGSDGSLAAKWQYSKNWILMDSIAVTVTHANTLPTVVKSKFKLTKPITDYNPAAIKFKFLNATGTKGQYLNWGFAFKKKLR